MVKLVVKRDLKKFFPQEFSNRKLIGQFIDYVMNHFFQESIEEEVNGYIGKKTVAMEKGDYYIEEPTYTRQTYQLTPSLVTIDENNKTKIVDYSSFINTLKLQGVDTNDIGRIIDGNYWSWSPLINADMFINYNYYYWVEGGTNTYIIDYETNALQDIIGKTSFDIIVDGNTIEVLSGMRIIFKNDVNSEYNNKVYIVENVGKSIMLIDDTDSKDIATIPDYFVMERGCQDGNKWSLRNRWFHRSVIKGIDERVNFVQAKKPILCFNRDIELYNHGTYSRGYVDFVYDGLKTDIHGKSFSSVLMQGERELKDGDRILIIGDFNVDNNNMIYEVSGKDTLGTIILQVLYNGLSENGQPVYGEDVNCLSGMFAGKCFHYDGNKWIEGQQKISVNQSPLFKLFDKDGIELDNKLYYNQSSFKGSKLFDYKVTEEESAIVDDDLGRKIITGGYGNYIFENLLETEKYTYMNYMDIEEIKGYKFVRINSTNEYLNDWKFSSNNVNNYISTEFRLNPIVYTEEVDEESGLTSRYIKIEMGYEPIDSDVRNSSYVYVNGRQLLEGNQYEFDKNVLKIFPNVDLQIDDYVYVKVLVDKLDEKLKTGYFYDLPLSLTSNPLNESITEIKYNECFNQLTSIIGNQRGFIGNSAGDNNYNNTAKDTSLGTEIVQHSNPILRTMLLNSSDSTNVRNVINFVSNEYLKFMTKFKNVIETMSKTNEYLDTFDLSDVEKDVYLKDVIKKALFKISTGKDGLHPFYNNGVCEQLEMDCYIPSSASYLGIDSVFKPRFTTIEDKPDNMMVLLCHDGSYQQLFNDYRDEALLKFEEMIYESIPQKFRNNLYTSKYELIPGKFRETDYTYDEYKDLLSPFFEKWCMNNGIDYSNNDSYDVQNPFSWNYTGCIDNDGNMVDGSYKALYMYYYDTYRPHTHPWEMLGFVDKPDWWEEKYGKAPYTSNNIPMWTDIENGYVSDGESKGYYKVFERKGLVDNYIPVDSKGNLLTPLQCNIITKMPTSYYASRNWRACDMSNIECAWRYSSDFKFALQTVLYLMKPVRWVEENWETLNKELLFKGTSFEQLIYTDTMERTTSEETIIHNELVDNQYIRRHGIQQWVSDYLVYRNLGITEIFGNPYRNTNVQLFYKCGSYYKNDSLKVFSDNYGLIPSENHHLKVMKSYSSNNYSYSALMIIKVDGGYMIKGYDLVEPYFNVLEPDKANKKTSVEINGRNVTYYNVWKNEIRKIKYNTIFTSVQELFNVICGYGKYLNYIEGWEFTLINDEGRIVDYTLKAEDFLLWVSNNPETNQLIILNPGSTEIRLNHPYMLDIVGKYMNGVWSVLGTAQKPIYNDKLEVYRHQGYTDIVTNDDLFASLRLNCVEYEHGLLFDSKTIYGYVLYDPLKCIKTNRFKLSGVRSTNWNGTLFAPGYLIQDDGCISNFDKLSNDFNYIYDTDDIRSYGEYRRLAQETIGYQESTTFENLLLSDRNMFDFYKGLLKEKGTRRSFGKLNRSSYIMSSTDSKIDLFDNWAFKLSDFGYTKYSSSIELDIDSTKINQNPQIITFSTNKDYKTDNLSVINVNIGSERWLKRIDVIDENRFKYCDSIPSSKGGFLQFGDVDYVVSDLDTFEQNLKFMNNGETIWVVKTLNNDWNVYKKLSDEQYMSLRVDTIQNLKTFEIDKLDDGDLIFVSKDIVSKYDYSENDDSENDDTETNEIQILDKNNLLSDSKSIIDKMAWSIFKVVDEECIVNDGIETEETIVKKRYLTIHRIQQKIVDSTKFDKCYIIDDYSSDTLSQIQIYDPIMNVIPNNVLDEVNYITSYDPVFDYNDSYKWGDSKVGFLWWDTSKVKYLDYHQGDLNYKRDNWGKQLPGSEIAIMEWTMSTIEPDEGVKYVHKKLWNSQTLTYDNYYYYWVKNPAELPSVNFRTISALNISNVINNPTEQGIIWMSPIDLDYDINYNSTFILANFDTVTTGSDFVVQLNFKDDKELNSHTEWIMVREGDDDEIPDLLWERMRYSLLGEDSYGNSIPDEELPERNRYGIQIRPRQSMFKDMVTARRNFVDIINGIFETRDPSLSIDVGTSLFEAVFENIDKEPENDYEFETYREMINSRDSYLFGKTVLVKRDEEHDDIWTLWRVEGFGKFTMIDYQKYDVRKYWKYVDLYRDEDSIFIQPDHNVFNSEREMVEYINENNVLKGSYFKYLVDGKWILVEYHGKDFEIPLEIVGIQDGTIEINDKIYSYLNDKTLSNDNSPFIEYETIDENGLKVIKTMTKYEYVDTEAKTVINDIIDYFEKV